VKETEESAQSSLPSALFHKREPAGENCEERLRKLEGANYERKTYNCGKEGDTGIKVGVPEVFRWSNSGLPGETLSA